LSDIVSEGFLEVIAVVEEGIRVETSFLHFLHLFLLSHQVGIQGDGFLVHQARSNGGLLAQTVSVVVVLTGLARVNRGSLVHARLVEVHSCRVRIGRIERVCRDSLTLFLHSHF